MIRINLLPVEFRVVEAKKTKFSPQSVFLSVFFVVLLASLYESFMFIGVRKKLHDLEAEMTQLSGPSGEADQLNQNIHGKLVPVKRFFFQYVLANYLMAEAMNLLSDHLPESMWLSDLSVKREQETIRLDLTGFSRITSKQIAVAQIQEYVNSVKAKLEGILKKTDAGDESSGAQEIKVVLTTNLREIADMEAMQFAASMRSSLTAKAKKE